MKSAFTSATWHLSLRSIGKFSLFLGILWIFSACSEIIEKDISNTELIIGGPADKDTLTQPNLTFWWNKVEGASKYHLEIVQPNFSQATKLIADTNLSDRTFSISLLPGHYAWKLYAFNENSKTAILTRSFYLDSSLNIVSTKVQLTSPIQNTSLHSKNVNFFWQALANATSYSIEIEDSINPGNYIPHNFTDPGMLNGTNFQLTFSNYGTYRWRIMAYNSTTQTNSQYSNWGYFSINIPAPTLLGPVEDSISINQIDSTVFSWTSDSNAAMDSILFYSNSTLQNKINALCKYTNQFSFIFGSSANFTTGNTYYWRARSFDSNGHPSPYSAVRSFKIIP